jgi:N-acetyl-anhydromuramyl-L-alanine amidase AmpD
MGSVYGVIFHGSRSGRPEFSLLRGDGSEGKKTLAYVKTPGTTSYNWLIDYDGTIYELAGWGLQAWHAGHRTTAIHMNTNWYGVCFAQADTWEPVTPQQHASGRWLAKQISERTGVPLVRRSDVSSRYATRGFTQHMDTAQGQSGGKSDVGPLLRWVDLGL